ncbi:hypothetical protein [Aestuariibacter sp. A3R04]|uniref:hypothetical protein n=1 Tax=Aestuariibacter sp. A3R04 TaxID=2841571 RepID=UPI001C0A0DB6|nr:hypothetical protein [Aestuariibacter sp. A3R04]MBU3022102.1 hypothetical protein [Aestuariibacter sp. A3R04]
MTDHIHALLSLAAQAENTLLQDTNASATHCAQKTASALLRQGRENPDCLLALFYLSGDDQKRPSTALRHASLMAFIGILQQYNDHYLQHLVAATFCVTALRQTERAMQVQRAFWLQKKLRLFTELSRLSRVTDHHSPIAFLRIQTLTLEQRWYILVVAICNNKTLAIVDVLKRAIPHIPVHQRHCFAALVNYPLDSLPGCEIIYKEQQGVLINHLSPDRALIWLDQKSEFADVSLSKTQIQRRAILSFSQWSKLLNQSPVSALALKNLAPRSFPVSNLPADLASIVTMLQDSALDINKLVAALNKHPFLADFLKKMAGQENRLRIAVNEVKQAVMTYGLQRLADMLVLRALTQRLQQKGFPLLATCNRISDVGASVASRLAEMSPTSSLTPQCAALLATFSIAPLYSLPSLKTRKKWPAATGPAHRLDSFAKDSNDTMQKMAVTLAAQWRQPALYQSILSHSGSSASDIPVRIKADSVIAGLSLQLTNRWLFAHSPHPDDARYYRESLGVLKVSDADITTIQRDISPLLWLPLTE